MAVNPVLSELNPEPVGGRYSADDGFIASQISDGAMNAQDVGANQIDYNQPNIKWTPQWIQNKWQQNQQLINENNKMQAGRKYLDKKYRESYKNGELGKDEYDALKKVNNTVKKNYSNASPIASNVGLAIGTIADIIGAGGMPKFDGSRTSDRKSDILENVRNYNEDMRKVGQESAEGGMNAMQATNENARQRQEVINNAELSKRLGELSPEEQLQILTGALIANGGSLAQYAAAAGSQKLIDVLDSVMGKLKGNAGASMKDAEPETPAVTSTGKTQDDLDAQKKAEGERKAAEEKAKAEAAKKAAEEEAKKKAEAAKTTPAAGTTSSNITTSTATSSPLPTFNWFKDANQEQEFVDYVSERAKQLVGKKWRHNMIIDKNIYYQAMREWLEKNGINITVDKLVPMYEVLFQ